MDGALSSIVGDYESLAPEVPENYVHDAFVEMTAVEGQAAASIVNEAEESMQSSDVLGVVRQQAASSVNEDEYLQIPLKGDSDAHKQNSNEDVNRLGTDSQASVLADFVVTPAMSQQMAEWEADYVQAQVDRDLLEIIFALPREAALLYTAEGLKTHMTRSDDPFKSLRVHCRSCLSAEGLEVDIAHKDLLKELDTDEDGAALRTTLLSRHAALVADEEALQTDVNKYQRFLSEARDSKAQEEAVLAKTEAVVLDREHANVKLAALRAARESSQRVITVLEADVQVMVEAKMEAAECKRCASLEVADEGAANRYIGAVRAAIAQGSAKLMEADLNMKHAEKERESAAADLASGEAAAANAILEATQANINQCKVIEDRSKEETDEELAKERQVTLRQLRVKIKLLEIRMRQLPATPGHGLDDMASVALARRYIAGASLAEMEGLIAALPAAAAGQPRWLAPPPPGLHPTGLQQLVFKQASVEQTVDLTEDDGETGEDGHDGDTVEDEGVEGGASTRRVGEKSGRHADNTSNPGQRKKAYVISSGASTGAASGTSAGGGEGGTSQRKHTCHTCFEDMKGHTKARCKAREKQLLAKTMRGSSK